MHSSFIVMTDGYKKNNFIVNNKSSVSEEKDNNNYYFLILIFYRLSPSILQNMIFKTPVKPTRQLCVNIILIIIINILILYH